ncbi:hypothetical protein LTR66_015753, partial [Elasticomyces elasticus]
MATLQRKEGRDRLHDQYSTDNIESQEDMLHYELNTSDAPVYGEHQHEFETRILNDQETHADPFPDAVLHDESPSSIDTIMVYKEDTNNIQTTSFQKLAARKLCQQVLLPSIALCVPMIFLAALLLYIVYSRRVTSAINTFAANDTSYMQPDPKYVYVDYQDTKLVYLASFLSTLAPALAGCIMCLVAIVVGNELRKLSRPSRFMSMPTDRQVGLISGLLSASYMQLYEAVIYACSRRRTKVSVTFRQALIALLLSIALSISLIVADAVLHMTTRTVSFTQFDDDSAPQLPFGKGVSAYCLDLNRIHDNYGFPCSYAMDNRISLTQGWLDGQAEIQELLDDTSNSTEMQWVTIDALENRGMSVLMPRISSIPSDINFHASTIGVAASCKLVTIPTCNTRQVGLSGQMTSFGCSDNFWGTLGTLPNTPFPGSNGTSNSLRAIQTSKNLIYNFYTAPDLMKVYNVGGFQNVLEGITYAPQNSSTPWPDSELGNPVTAMFAWRTGRASFLGGSRNGMITSGQVFNPSNWTFTDYFVSCEITSYDFDYIWVNSSIASYQYSKTNNGTLLNEWTAPFFFSGSDRALQDYNSRAVVTGNTTKSYLYKFTQSLAQDALATIGGYSTSRVVIRQQSQRVKLLSRVPKAALGTLIACSLCYPVL